MLLLSYIHIYFLYHTKEQFLYWNMSTLGTTFPTLEGLFLTYQCHNVRGPLSFMDLKGLVVIAQVFRGMLRHAWMDQNTKDHTNMLWGCFG